AWTGPLAAAGVAVAPLRPANVGFAVDWSRPFRERFAGAPLKRVRLSLDGEHRLGEALITASGIEGGAVYALSRLLRERIDREGVARLSV
ncbi:NAD(P)/FAD-dependent oxidoreductase, partial [Enterobacter hormaechei]